MLPPRPPANELETNAQASGKQDGFYWSIVGSVPRVRLFRIQKLIGMIGWIKCLNNMRKSADGIKELPCLPDNYSVLFPFFENSGMECV